MNTITIKASGQEVIVSIANIIDALKAECGVYKDNSSFYTTKMGKLYRISDIDRANCECEVVSDDPGVVSLYEAVDNLEWVCKVNRKCQFN